MNRLPLVLLCAFFALTLTQDLASLPACGQICVNSVSAGAAVTSGCAINDASCYCSRYAFADKVDSCASKTCISLSASSDIASINSYLDSYCGTSTSSTSTSATATATTTTAAATNTTTTTPSPASKSSSGVSTGGKLGIAIGAFLGASCTVGLVGALLFASRRRHRRDEAARQTEATKQFIEAAHVEAAKKFEGPDDFQAVKKAEAARRSGDASWEPQIQELDGKQIPKMPNRKTVARSALAYALPTDLPAVEMDISPASSDQRGS